MNLECCLITYMGIRTADAKRVYAGSFTILWPRYGFEGHMESCFLERDWTQCY